MHACTALKNRSSQHDVYDHWRSDDPEGGRYLRHVSYKLVLRMGLVANSVAPAWIISLLPSVTAAAVRATIGRFSPMSRIWLVASRPSICVTKT